MIIKIPEGKSLREVIELLELKLPESISQDEIEEIASLIHGSRGSEIYVSEDITVEVIL